MPRTSHQLDRWCTTIEEQEEEDFQDGRQSEMDDGRPLWKNRKEELGLYQTGKVDDNRPIPLI